MNSNDPEQFEYIANTIQEIQTLYEPLAFSNSYIRASASPAVCSICFRKQTNFQSLICNHAFCYDCWSQYIETKFQSYNCLSKINFFKSYFFFQYLSRYGMYEM